MSLTIITQSQNLAKQISQILLHYFPSGKNHLSNKMVVTLHTKYYECDIPIICLDHNLKDHFQKLNQSEAAMGISESKQNQAKIKEKAEETLEKLGKTDMLVFVFDQLKQGSSGEHIRGLIDKTILQLQPQSYIVCINSLSTENKIAYEQIIRECQNFIMVISMNSKQILEKKPTWNRSALLNEEQEYQNQFFEVLELMQTTAWTNSAPRDKIKKDVESQDGKVAQPENNAEKKQYEEMEELENEEALQKQMMEFQSLMQQMMSLKMNPGTGNERKLKAEQLIMKLANNCDI